MLPLVAIIGRANVGKSTLFNRLVGRAQALVHDQPGVTRDPLYGQVTRDERAFILVDTGGFGGYTDALSDQVRQQAEAAAVEADLILFLVDGRQELQPDDLEVAAFLRRLGKPVLLVVNKIDTPAQEATLAEFYRLGLTPLVPISAAHGLGVETLVEEILRRLPPAAPAVERPGLRVAILGRPNVGKSSFINRVLGQDRLLVSAEPGTTRDALEVPLTWEGKPYVLIDTAGIRRRSRVSGSLEQGMVWQALRALQRAEVVFFLADAQEGITDQDLKILQLVTDAGKGCLIGLNKWDLLPGDRQERTWHLDRATFALRLLPHIPIQPLSVKTGYQVAKVFPLLEEIHRQCSFRVATGALNRLLAEIVASHPPPRFQSREVKLYYITQTGTNPPTFVIFTNLPQGVPAAYSRYLINQLRQRLHLPYAPIRLLWRGRERRPR